MVNRPKEKTNEGKSTEKKSGKSAGGNAEGAAAPVRILIALFAANLMRCSHVHPRQIETHE